MILKINVCNSLYIVHGFTEYFIKWSTKCKPEAYNVFFLLVFVAAEVLVYWHVINLKFDYPFD